MASVHLDLASSSFGVQEENHFEEAELAVFEGVAQLEGGYLYANEAPGLGMHLDEKAARSLLDPQLAKRSYFIAEDRRRDGEILRP
jgi:mannonate dehydratase